MTFEEWFNAALAAGSAREIDRDLTKVAWEAGYDAGYERGNDVGREHGRLMYDDNYGEERY